MAIENPITYGDHYWRKQVDAQAMFDEQIESALAPYFAGLLGGIPEIAELPIGVQTFLTSLAEPPSAGMGNFAALTAGEFASEALRDLIKPGISAASRAINRGALETWLTASQAVTLHHRQQIDDEYFALLMHSEGYADSVAEQYANALLPYPSIPDIMLYARYHGQPDNIRSVVWEHYNLPPDMFDLWEWQTLQRLSTEQVQRLFKRGVIDETEFNYRLSEIGWTESQRPHMKDLSYLYPNAMLLVQGELQQGVETETIITDITRSDIHPDFAQTYLDAILTKPATSDIIAYQLRQDSELTDLDQHLRKIGIHPEYTDVYKTLAFPIPPIADLITMAVREAFTPAIAERFGQYEDFPTEFETWAGKKGVSSEWAKRYWASHWMLPSATQGFSMLHRGIIDEPTLHMLLRALDVMPFWRDKLVKVAYRPLTRVDVRRMYKEGILDEAGVFKAYQDHGYGPDNARAMTDFTVQYVLTQQTKFTTLDVISAYSQRMITASTTRTLLTMLGVRSENLSFIISTADYKREWEFTEQRIKGIKNLYKRKVYNRDKARDELGKLNIATEQIQVLMQQWWYEIKEEPTHNWSLGQTIKFIGQGLITEERGKQELKELGYDDEHIEIYIRSMKWIPPKN